jgi:phosphatidylglycerophosphatase A
MVNLIIFIATGAYAGYSLVLPGTIGTLVGVLIYNYFFPAAPSQYLLYTVLLFIAGKWASAKAEVIFDEKGSSRIVIGEIVGFLVAMFTIPGSFWWIFFGFIIYRLFDIIRPAPIDRLEELENGWGLMLDDVMAGIYTNLLLQIINLIFT